MGDQPERRCAIRACHYQRRTVEVTVARGAGPDCRQRHQMRQVEGGHQRLPHIGVGIAGDGRQPGLHGVEALGKCDEAASLDHPLHQSQLLVSDLGIAVAHCHGGGQVAKGDLVGAQFLQRRIGVAGLVRRVAVEQGAFLLEERFAQQRQDALALGEPLPAQAHQFLLGLVLVQADEAGRPAIGDAQAVEVIQQARPGRGGKTAHREHPQVLLAQPRCQTRGQRTVGQQRVQMERHLRHLDSLAVRRHRGVQVGQRLAVVEPGQLGHNPVQQVEEAIALDHEGGQPLVPVDAAMRPVLVKQAGGAGA
ncbi:hypothetical protein D9M69_376300 [compost metagenome]